MEILNRVIDTIIDKTNNQITDEDIKIACEEQLKKVLRFVANKSQLSFSSLVVLELLVMMKENTETVTPVTHTIGVSDKQWADKLRHGQKEITRMAKMLYIGYKNRKC